MTFAVIGLGGRGSTYAHFIKYYGSEIVAVCDTDEKKRELAKKYGVSDDMFFTSEDEFFAKGKLADALVIATMDSLHYRQAIKALELGYHILLEKPIAMTLEECREIRDLAVKRDRRVVVCHVLRYSPMYMKIKDLLDEGAIGDVISVDIALAITRIWGNGDYSLTNLFRRFRAHKELLEDPDYKRLYDEILEESYKNSPEQTENKEGEIALHEAVGDLMVKDFSAEPERISAEPLTCLLKQRKRIWNLV